MQFGGINLYVKFVLMTIKIQLYFWKKKANKQVCQLLCKKKRVKTAFILKEGVYSKMLSLLCTYMEKCPYHCNSTVLFAGFYLEPPILTVTECTLLISVQDLDNSSGF